MITKKVNDFKFVNSIKDINHNMMWPNVYNLALYGSTYDTYFITFIYGLDYSDKLGKFIITKQELLINTNLILFNCDDIRLGREGVWFFHSKARSNKAIKRKKHPLNKKLKRLELYDYFKKEIAKVPKKSEGDFKEMRSFIDNYVKFILIDRVYKEFYKANLSKPAGLEDQEAYTYSYLQNLKKLYKLNNIKDYKGDIANKFKGSFRHNIKRATELLDEYNVNYANDEPDYTHCCNWGYEDKEELN